WSMAPYKQVSLAAQGIEYTCKFHGDIAGAHHSSACRGRCQFEEAVRVNAMFGPRDVGPLWAAAGSDQDVIGGVALAVDIDGVRICKTPCAADDVDAVLVQDSVVRSVDAVNVCASVLDQSFPVETVHCGVKAVVRAVAMDRLGDLCCMPHDFFRYTAHIDACATEFLCLDQCAFL